MLLFHPAFAPKEWLYLLHRLNFPELLSKLLLSRKVSSYTVNAPLPLVVHVDRRLLKYEHLYNKPFVNILTGETGKLFVIDKVEDLLR